MSRLSRIARSWLSALGRAVPGIGDSDPFGLRSSDALKDPAVRAALKRWRAGEISTKEFREWLDEKWEKDHA